LLMRNYPGNNARLSCLLDVMILAHTNLSPCIDTMPDIIPNSAHFGTNNYRTQLEKNDSSASFTCELIYLLLMPTASEEPRVKKLLVQHIETVHHSEAVEDVLQSLLVI
jgi:hypothetical protein